MRAIVRLFGGAGGGGYGGGQRGGIAARGAAAGKGVFFPGKAAGGTAYRREKSAAVRTGFGVPFNFLIAVIAEKTGFFAQNCSLSGLRGRFGPAVSVGLFGPAGCGGSGALGRGRALRRAGAFRCF